MGEPTARHHERPSDRRAFKRVDRNRVLKLLRERRVHSVLDVGCGVGRTVEALCELGFDAHGVTVNEDEIRRSPVADRVTLADVQQPMRLPGAPFDAAISFDCLEHLENPSATLRNINAVLRDGAPLICYIPPEKSQECDYHVIVYTPRQMKWLLNRSGFRLLRTQGRFRGKGVTYYAIKAGTDPLAPGRMK